MLYRILQHTIRWTWRLFGRLEVVGREHIPTTGPFLLVANHQSILDPLLIQAVCPRIVHTMAKSTQFSSRALAWLMVRVHSFPVRRYQTDPQAVRIALRRLGRGDGVGIYLEGERTWDGRLQAPRLGTLRLILKAGVPVIPCAITGAYQAWPRWASRPQPRTIRITFERPIRFPRIDDRDERDRHLPETADRLVGALRSHLDAPRDAAVAARRP